MTDLTATQRTILAAAAVRPGMRILPLPDRIKGGAAKKVLDALLARGLVAETTAVDGESSLKDGITLVATAEAFRALGITVPHAEVTESIDQPSVPKVEPVSTSSGTLRLRDGTKQAVMIKMLRSSPQRSALEPVR